MLQAGQQIILTYILPNNSQSKGNQAIIFGQLIQYRMGNIFPQKSFKKWDREITSRFIP